MPKINPGRLPTIKSYNWDEIAHHYDGFSAPMHCFIGQIIESKYCTGLYGATSLWTLMIAQTPEFQFVRNAIVVNEKLGVFTFEFVDSADDKKNWRRVVDEAHAFETFERLLISLKWFLY